MQLDEEPRRHESALLRRLALAGMRQRPSWFLRVGRQLIGTLFALALPEERQRVRAALRRVHGPRAPHVEERDVLRTFRDYSACLAEGMGGDRLEAEAAEAEVHGREHLSRVLSRGSGAVLVTAHVGPWDAAARLLS